MVGFLIDHIRLRIEFISDASCCRMTIIPPERHILALPSDELEKFAREWAVLKKGYFGVERFSGPGDMARDVVGYLTKAKHEGDWHNYQCKQYGKQNVIYVGR